MTDKAESLMDRNDGADAGRILDGTTRVRGVQEQKQGEGNYLSSGMFFPHVGKFRARPGAGGAGIQDSPGVRATDSQAA